MKKSKKLVSLLLALAFAFSLMATTALAAEPQGVVLPGTCPHCGEFAAITGSTERILFFELRICSLNPHAHVHGIERWTEYYDCSICGYVAKDYAKDRGCLTMEFDS